MKKIVWHNEETEIAAITSAAPKANIERDLGKKLTDEEYENFVIERSIPQGKKFKKVDDSELPSEPVFRNAWLFDEKAEKVCICCEKARDVALRELRIRRNKALDESDKNYMRVQETGSVEEIHNLKIKRQKLRDATNELKGLNVAGKIDDEALLAKITEEMNQELSLDKLEVVEPKAKA